MLRRIISMMIVMVVSCCLTVSAFAHDAVDMNKTGVISITMHCGNTPVGGGTISLYRVGAVHHDNGDYSFVPTEYFADCGLDFSDITSSDLADDLYAYAKRNNIPTVSYTIDKNGYIAFGVDPGLYMMAQEKAAEGYNKMAPFLVSVPVMRDGKYVYEVDASPKMDLVKVTPTPPPTPTPRPTLPQTGQLNWPVPVLAVGGMALFAIGWVLRYTGKREDNEE